MTTEVSASAGLRPSRRPISGLQMEVVASRSVAVFGLLFGAQTFPVMLAQADLLRPVWFWGYNAAIFGGLLLSVVASFTGRFVQPVNAWIAISYLVAMASWPLAVTAASETSQDRPWLWFLCTVATAAAAIAFSRWVAALYVVAAPLVYGIVRMTPAGGGEVWDLAALDTVYAVLLGGAVLVIVTMLRGAAAAVDAAQATALARYSEAVRQHATEVERVRVDSIVHDSVLTTLSSAAKARSAEEMALSATMASHAIGHLKDAATAIPDGAEFTGVAEVAERLSKAAVALSARFTVDIAGIGSGTVSGQVAEALHAAAAQAMVNSVQHGGGDEGTEDGTDRWLRITGSDENGLHIEIGDNGVGFDAERVPAQRLGLRVSIVERIAKVGGSARIASHPGQGTVVTIRWPDPDGRVSEVVP